MPGTDNTKPDHQWLCATTIPISDQQARLGLMRRCLTFNEQVKVRVEDVYCGRCRRPYDAVAAEPCLQDSETEFLHGGPIGERKKRTKRAPLPAGVRVEAGPVIDRRRIAV